MINIQQLNDTGYQILEGIAHRAPNLFFAGRFLKEELDREASWQGEDVYTDKPIELDVTLQPLNQVRESGPATDAYYAPLVRQALSNLSPASASDGLLWTSINCFVLSSYIQARWGSHHKTYQFVKRHWLWLGTEGRTWNASARLWWLAELANRASRFSNYSEETLLEAMAGEVGLYHQLTSRRYLAANAKVVAAIYDVVLDNVGHDEYNNYIFKKKYANELMKALNLRAGAISFDIFDYGELYELVEESLPPKEGGATE